MLHGDNQYNPKYLANMIELIDGSQNLDAVVGSRLMNKKCSKR